jgi:GrpB-like predicted nucleotidyltransferase (UPF0157 family)
MHATTNRALGPPGFTAERSAYGPGGAYPTPASRSPSARPLQSYDRRWPHVFAAERRRIRTVLRSLAPAVEHVGSSSIPGLWGRPEIDVLVGVRTRGDVDAGTRLLTAAGYLTDDRARGGGEPWSLLSRRGPIAFELLMVEYGGPLWTRHLGLRDYLRADPARALAYGRLKSRWAAAYGADTPRYKQAKRRFWARVEVAHPPSGG